jgi:hypothetical protein
MKSFAVGRRVWRGVLVGAAVLASSGWLLTASASATVIGPYSCGVLASGHWCLYNVRHSYFFAEAQYPGSPSDNIYVCQKTIYDATGGDYEQGCGYNETDANFPPVSYLKPLAGNFSGNNHTVYGYAAY